MQLSEYVGHDALGLAELIRSGQVSAVEVNNAALAACEIVNPRIRAVIETWPEDVSAAIDDVSPDAPFAGVPFLIKDLLLHMRGKRCELGSRLAQGLVSQADSGLMRRFRSAGLVTFGRTKTPEMGFSLATEPEFSGPVHNPWSIVHSAGGSSGGAAAVVAAGIVPMAHGNDGGGSIRIPASCCGVFGMKPTRGRVSAGPDYDEPLNGLVIEHALTRSVRDSAALLDAVQGYETGDPYHIVPPERPYLEDAMRDPASLRIGFMIEPTWTGLKVDRRVAQATTCAATLCERLGHHVEIYEPELGVSWDEFVKFNARIWCATLSALIDGVAAATGRPIDRTTLQAETLACYELGRSLAATDLLAALDLRNRVTRSFAAFYRRFDVLLSPTLRDLPLPLGVLHHGTEDLDGLGWTARVFENVPFTPVFNVTGNPAMSVPLAIDNESGLPIGIHFGAAYGREDLLFQLAGQLERASPWNARRPAIFAA